MLLDYDFRLRTRVAAVYENAGGGLAPDLRRRAASATIELVRDLMARHAWEEAEQIDWFARPLRELGINDAALVQALCDDLESRFDQANRLHPGADRLLAASDDLPRCIITNGYSHIQHPKLRQLGLDDGRFDAIFVSHEHGIWKPDPRIFELALAATGTSNAETLMIGDNPYTDIAGANAAGLQSIWINHGQLKLGPDDPEPTWEVADIGEAASLLESLCRREPAPVGGPK